MKKLVILGLIYFGLVLTGCALQPPVISQTPEKINQNINQAASNSAINTNQDQPICENKCGDGTCQSIVCLATGCPCAETTKNCVVDCY